MALRLERVLGVDAQTWMNLQLAVNMYDAQSAGRRLGRGSDPRRCRQR
jgi:plasmid maintenance system antidote protein VapI